MPASNFDEAFDFIMGPSRDGHQNDTAPGETFRTSWGITPPTWRYAVEHNIVEGKLEDATKEQARSIFRVCFWNALHCSALPSGYDALLFEQACLAGSGRAARILQHIVGVREDGAIGPITLRAACSYNVKELIDKQCVAFLAYLATLDGWGRFRNGWTNREVAAKDLAYKLARIA